MHLSIILPAYNESKRITRTLEDVDRYLSGQDYDYEIVVVNDGSKDETVKVVKDSMTRIKNLRIIDNQKNKGKGGVVKQGMLEAKGDYRLFADADNSTGIDQIEKMWPEFEKGFDVVIGSRDIAGAVLDPPQPWLRQVVLGEGFKLFRKLVIGLWDVQDSQCGFKCFSKKAAESVFPKARIDRFAFDPEVLVIAKKMGFKIKEVPVLWKNYAGSTVSTMNMVKMALDIFKIKSNSIKGLYD